MLHTVYRAHWRAPGFLHLPCEPRTFICLTWDVKLFVLKKTTDFSPTDFTWWITVAGGLLLFSVAPSELSSGQLSLSCSSTLLAERAVHGKLSLSILWQLHDNDQELNGHDLLILHNLPIEAIQVFHEVIVFTAHWLFPCYPFWRVTGESMSRWQNVSAITETTFPSRIITILKITQ